MSLNGSGVYTANTSGQPVQNGDTVDPDVFNALITDIATALSTAVFKDGQQTITANLPMANYILTGLGSGLANRGYSARIGDIQDGTAVFVDGGGTADAITATFVPAITAVVDGMELGVRATAANATTTPTFSPNGLTARTIKKQGGQALAAGDIRDAGHELRLRYVAATTHWELLNPLQPTLASLGAASTAAATTTAAGLIELATQAEVDAGVDTDRAIAPYRLENYSPDTATMDVANDLLIVRDATDSKLKKMAWPSILTQAPYARLEDQKSSGTAGGSASATTWHTRTLAEVEDAGGIVSVASNQFTLGTGTYYVRATAPAYAVNGHQLRIRNITDSTSPLLGSSAYAGNSDAVSSPAEVAGVITIAGSKLFELQHYATAARATDGLGAAGSSGAGEVYARVEIWRLA